MSSAAREARLHIDVDLGPGPITIGRYGNWSTNPAVPTSDLDPFVTIDLVRHFSVVTGDPDYLDDLSRSIADAAAALRAIRSVQAETSAMAGQPDLFGQGPA